MPTRVAVFKSPIAWVAVTYLGFVVPDGMHFPSGPTTPFEPGDLDASAALVGFVLGSVWGLLLGWLQWLVLRGWIGVGRAWIGLTAMALGLVHAINDVLPHRPVDLVVTLIVSGVLVGLAQTVALLRISSRAMAWLPVAAIAWVSGWSVAFAVSPSLAGDPLLELALGNGTAGFIFAAITAPVLWLLPRRRAGVSAKP